MSRMPRKGQPVAQIYQPEVSGRTVYDTAPHDRREWNLGLITDVVRMGHAVLSRVGDWSVAKTGYQSQMTDEPADRGRLDNLYEPLPGSRGARGRFGAAAYQSSEHGWVIRNHGRLALAAGAGLALGAAGPPGGGGPSIAAVPSAGRPPEPLTRRRGL